MRVEIYQFLLKKICIGKLGDIDVNAGLFLVVESGLLECVSFDTGVNGES
jgi:hypothetical protein